MNNGEDRVVPNFTGRLSEKAASELTFIEVLFTIIIAWILVTLWQRVWDNFTFGIMKLDPKSTFQTFLIAVLATIIFVTLSFTFNELVSGILIGGGQDTPFSGSIEGPVKSVRGTDNNNPFSQSENNERKRGPVEVDNVDSQNVKHGNFKRRRHFSSGRRVCENRRANRFRKIHGNNRYRNYRI